MKMDFLIVSLDALKKNLLNAKKATFASGEKPQKQDFTRIFSYKKNFWDYEDRYTGSIIDTGTEIFRYKKVPVWGMSYFGGVLDSFFSQSISKEIFIFLKKALLCIPENMPVRGPLFLKNDQWVYKNNIKGDIQCFNGKERIFFQSKLVYVRWYQGGIIRESTVDVLVK